MLGNEWDIEELQDFGLECEFLNDNTETTDIDDLFEDAQNTEEKIEDIKFSVHVPQELEEKVDEIKDIIKSAVSEYEGVEIK